MNYLILTPLAAMVVAMVVQIYALGRKMSEPEKMLRPIEGGLTAYQQQTIAHYKDWLASVNLEYRASYQFGTIQSVVFQQGNKPRFLNFMFHKQLIFSAESYLDDLTVLDTTISRNVGIFPRPGAYVQQFPGLSLPEVWQRHLEGEACLGQKFGYVWSPLSRPYMEILPAALRLRMQVNRAQFLWPFRALYRFVVNRFRRRHRTIAQQFP